MAIVIEGGIDIGPGIDIGGFSDGFYINIVNISGFTTANETITIRFMVIKAPNA